MQKNVGNDVVDAVIVVDHNGNPATAPTVLVDRSGTTATANTQQVMMPANPLRKGAWIQNTSSGDLWINSLGAAGVGSPSLKLASGAYYEFPSNGAPATAISVIGASAGQTWSAREW